MFRRHTNTCTRTRTHRFLWLMYDDTALTVKLNWLVKLVNNNYPGIKSLFLSFQQTPALSEQCSPVAIVIADTAPYFRLVFGLLLPWDLHPSLSLSFYSTCCSSPTSPHCLCILVMVERILWCWVAYLRSCWKKYVSFQFSLEWRWQCPSTCEIFGQGQKSFPCID